MGTHQDLAGTRERDKGPEKVIALCKVGPRLELQPGVISAAKVQLHGGCDGGDMGKEWICQSDIFLGHHVDQTHDPGGVQEDDLRRPPPECIRNCELGVVLGGHNVQEGVVQHGQNGMICELQFQPGDPVCPVHGQVFRRASIELDSIISMA